MARMSKKTEIGITSPKGSSSGSQSAMSVSEPAASKAQAKVVPVGKPNTNVLTHQMIEQRASEIWKRKGCPAGQDEKNWLEAEAQLKKELGIK
jgi:hypothetical protein